MTQDQATTSDTQPTEDQQDALVRHYGDLAGALSGPQNGYDVLALPTHSDSDADYGAPDGWKVAPAGTAADVKIVTVVGTLQSKPEIGCSKDWEPKCETSRLNFQRESGLWEGTFKIDPGEYEYKVAIDNDWIVNYGAGGVKDGEHIPIKIPDKKSVTFFYDQKSHAVWYILND